MNRLLILFAATAVFAAPLHAQQPAPATTETAAPVSPPPAAPSVTPPTDKKSKSKKDEYTGPTNIVEQPPTPMLDDEGKQRLDPEGKPMWNEPVKQQRDKNGHPLFDASGKPVFQTASDLGYDEKGHKIHPPKEKKVKMTPISIRRGTLTVDGMTGKVALNYDIADLKFIYLYVPGIGVTIVSNEPFKGSIEEQDAFHQKTLTVTVSGHTLELASDGMILGKGKPAPAYVTIDRQFRLPTPYPAMGYGTILNAPYQWPGAKENQKITGVDAPSTPKNLMPVLALKPCPAGQMRRSQGPVLPGENQPDAPCVPIDKGTAPLGPAS